MLDMRERAELLQAAPESAVFIKEALGSEEFINGIDRYCIWVDSADAARASAIPELAQRFERCASARMASKKPATKRLSATPHRFAEVRYTPSEAIIVPSVSSGLREYIPVGYLGPDTVVTNLAFAAYEAEPWVLGVLTSKMHMTWVRAVAGRMRINYRYSNTIVYNNFPVPPLSEAMKEDLTIAALRVHDVREYHCERTLGDLYDPDLMPDDLREAHGALDALVDSIYSKHGYKTDEERLSDLFGMYEAMTAAEAAKAPAKKARGARR